MSFYAPRLRPALEDCEIDDAGKEQGVEGGVTNTTFAKSIVRTHAYGQHAKTLKNEPQKKEEKIIFR